MGRWSWCEFYWKRTHEIYQNHINIDSSTLYMLNNNFCKLKTAIFLKIFYFIHVSTCAIIKITSKMYMYCLDIMTIYLINSNITLIKSLVPNLMTKTHYIQCLLFPRNHNNKKSKYYRDPEKLEQVAFRSFIISIQFAWKVNKSNMTFL